MNNLRIFRVVRKDDRTRIETLGKVLGWGVEFPRAGCFVDWNLDAFPEEDRLDDAHVSQYGSFSDVEQGTGGEVEVVEEVEMGA
jgi:hypothetical protein